MEDFLVLKSCQQATFSVSYQKASCVFLRPYKLSTMHICPNNKLAMLPPVD